MNPASLLAQSEDAKFLNVPYDKRWEPLKPVIVQLYLGCKGENGKSMTISQVIIWMRDNYSFYAAETQYRRWFKQWGVRKRTLTSEKNDIIRALGKRTHEQASTSSVTLKGDSYDKHVEKKQLTRYLGDQLRHQTIEPLSPGVLSSWTLPYAALPNAFGQKPDQPSPFPTTGATPSYLDIRTPEEISPGRQPAGLSPMMQLIREKAARDRTSLLLQGRSQELLRSCENDDRV
ncbi:hypothetical protein QBC35DRAFT_518250 [Podospora australis]|uniref:Clr5 domain-containing protein n=1 Tax=Podospora australis TaxID=1536484 RepID=A0AAN6WLC1_9PEZI|nr:hypothetical protein QBC35DRAFT_518250 [Podospora australis]